jgi:glycosyltransferase involved in cell wall biosynthesis
MSATAVAECPAAAEVHHRPTPPPAGPRPRRRVLHIINGEVYGGAERALDLLAQRLGSLGIEVGFACLKPALFPVARRAQSAPLYEVPMRGRWDLRPAWKIARLVRERGYEAVYAHTARSAMIASLVSRLTGVPFVYHVQSPTAQDTTRRVANFVNATVERLALRRASALIAVSESLAERLRKAGYPENLTVVVPNGSPAREDIPPRTPPNGEWTLGMTALFRPRKGIEVLLRALAILKAEGLPVRLRAVGPFEDSEYERKVKSLADELGVSELIEWVGFTRETDRELDRMDLFVLPSLFGEGTPLVLSEAMASGVPAVTTRVEGNPELIRDGQDGLVVEPGDAGGLARAIARIIRGEVDWQTLRRNALARHRERFSDRAMAAGVAAVYGRVLSRK